MLSIIVPVFNEEKHINRLVLGFVEDLGKSGLKNWELLLVNDGSTDNTKNELQKLVNHFKYLKNRKISVINHPVNLGYGAAIKTGLLHSTNQNCAIIDADSTYSMSDLLVLFKLFRNENFDMVVGSRKKHFSNEKLIKKILRHSLRILVEYMASSKIPDINSGLRIFKKSALNNKEFLLSDRFSFTSTITLLFLLEKKTIKYFPISYGTRKGKSKVKLFRDGVSTVGLILTLAAYLNPMKLLFPILCSLAALIPLALLLIYSTDKSSEFLLLFIMIISFCVLLFLAISLHVLGFLIRAIPDNVFRKFQ